MARTKVPVMKGPLQMRSPGIKNRKKIIQGVDEIPSPSHGGIRKTRSKSAATTPTPAVADPRFKTTNYHKLYIQNFGTRKIAHGRVVDFDALEKNDAGFVREWFRAQRWDKLLEEREPVYPDLVLQFYTHFDHSNKEEGEIHTWVKGVDIVLDDHTLGKILNIPTTGLHDLPGKKWSTAKGFDKEQCIMLVLMDEDAELDNKPRVDQLPMPTRLLHLIVMHTFVSRVGKKSSLTFLDLLVMHCILGKVKINMPKLMIKYMNASQKATNGGSLPYGMWLTKVFRYFNVDLSNEAYSRTRFRAFNQKTISGSIGYYFDQSTGLWTKIGIKRAPKREGASEKEDVKRGTVEEDGVKYGEEGKPSEVANETALFPVFVLQEMFRRMHPELFTTDQMLSIHDAAQKEMHKHLSRSDAETFSGNIIGDDDSDDDVDAASTGDPRVNAEDDVGESCNLDASEDIEETDAEGDTDGDDGIDGEDVAESDDE